jgi:hypothetical protein
MVRSKLTRTPRTGIIDIKHLSMSKLSSLAFSLENWLTRQHQPVRPFSEQNQQTILCGYLATSGQHNTSTSQHSRVLMASNSMPKMLVRVRVGVEEISIRYLKQLLTCFHNQSSSRPHTPRERSEHVLTKKTAPTNLARLGLTETSQDLTPKIRTALRRLQPLEN